jgi:hypothetical protein
LKLRRAVSVPFDNKKFAAMSAKDRISFCRVQAREAREMAALNNAHQLPYLELAEQWDRLAEDILTSGSRERGELRV